MVRPDAEPKRYLEGDKLMVLKAVIAQPMLLPFIVGLAWSLDSWIAFSAMHPPFIIFAAISIGLISLPFLFVRKPTASAIPGALTVFLLGLPLTIASSLKPLRWEA